MGLFFWCILTASSNQNIMTKHTILAALMAVSTLALAQTSQDPWEEFQKTHR